MDTARAARINRWTAKSRCASEWGAWGRLSDDGPGQHNPDWSEDPWGKAAISRLHGGAPAHRTSSTQREEFGDTGSGMHEGRRQTVRHEELVIDRKARLKYRP